MTNVSLSLVLRGQTGNLDQYFLLSSKIERFTVVLSIKPVTIRSAEDLVLPSG